MQANPCATSYLLCRCGTCFLVFRLCMQLCIVTLHLKKIFFPHATRKVYVWLLVSFIISLDKTTCLKRIIKQSHSTACLLAALLLASLKACGSVLKAISHGNTLLVSNDLIPPLLHTLRIVFYKKLCPSHLYRILKSTFTMNLIML